MLEHTGQPACLHMAAWPLFSRLDPLYGLLGGMATTGAGLPVDSALSARVVGNW